ncbi:AAA-like domain-containing protein [Coleofasciculus sp. H7-2]|uniref:AAA-like domain-containing protein n=1 Tax=Coleofasciculus sp. H7-2 TaxID=3351545 RepID=UPI00366C24A5
MVKSRKSWKIKIEFFSLGTEHSGNNLLYALYVKRCDRMNVDEVLEAVEQVLLSRQLNHLERLILRQSWLGHDYSEMARDSAYSIPHLKEVGSQLWQDLSAVLGQRVTKKNLNLLLNQYQQNRTLEQIGTAPRQLPTSTRTPENFPAPLTATEIKFPSGGVPLDSPLYINLPSIEELACTEITQPQCLLWINAPKQMGKSSLLNRILAGATAVGYKTVYLDFQEAEEAIFASFDKFLRWFCANVSRQLNLNPMLDDYWDEDMGSKVSCKIYFESYLLKQLNTPVVLALNEVNRVFEHPNIAQDFLGMLRFWHEQAQQVEIWQKLRLVVIYAPEGYLSLKLNQSPFNVGLSIRLPQFTSEQVQDLAVRYGLNWTDDEIQKLMAMVGGHPYLVSVALYYLCRKEMTLEELLLFSPTLGGVYSHHLRDYLAILREQPPLASALQQVVTANGSVRLEAIAAHKLESMGLVQLDGNQVRVSCELYRLYFRQQLGKENETDVLLKQLEQEKQNFQDLYNIIDEVTHLANRRYFNQYLETKWQQLLGEILPLSLILCDVDYFNFYTNIRGNLAGDASLERIARTTRQCVADRAALVARYGVTEFAVLLPQTHADVAILLAENIRQSIKALAIAHDHSNFDGFPADVLTVSLGVATITPSPQISPAILIATAEEALLQSKRQGRDRVSICCS